MRLAVKFLRHFVISGNTDLCEVDSSGYLLSGRAGDQNRLFNDIVCVAWPRVPTLLCESFLKYSFHKPSHQPLPFGGSACWAMPVLTSEIATRDRAFPAVQQFQVLISRGSLILQYRLPD